MQYTKIRLINISSGDNAVLLFADDAFLFFALLVSSSVSVAGSEDECMIDQDHGWACVGEAGAAEPQSETLSVSVRELWIATLVSLYDEVIPPHWTTNPREARKEPAAIVWASREKRPRIDQLVRNRSRTNFSPLKEPEQVVGEKTILPPLETRCLLWIFFLILIKSSGSWNNDSYISKTALTFLQPFRLTM